MFPYDTIETEKLLSPMTFQERAFCMEFNQKLQELRKAKGITQEELAQCLYVSRTAVSKWESGRGYPNIDSLKAIAAFFCVTVDELLSGEEILTIAKEENEQKEKHYRDLVFGLLDCCAALFFFLPLFGQNEGEIVRGASLLSLTGTEPYLKATYFAAVIGMILSGIFTLAFQNTDFLFFEKKKTKISFLLNAFGTLVFIASSQPYAAALLFVFLMIKVFFLIKTK